MSTLGAYIRERRLELGMTQEELANRAGDNLRQADISRLEHDRVSLPRRSRLDALAAALDVPVGAMLARSGWQGAENAAWETGRQGSQPGRLPSAGPGANGSGEESRPEVAQVLPEIESGSHLVVLASLEDEAFGERVAALNDYRAAAGPPLWVLTASDGEAHRSFFWRFGPAFEIREAPAPLLRSLYRRLPRSFLVSDGVVVETYAGLPPLASFAGDRTPGAAPAT